MATPGTFAQALAVALAEAGVALAAPFGQLEPSTLRACLERVYREDGLCEAHRRKAADDVVRIVFLRASLDAARALANGARTN